MQTRQATLAHATKSSSAFSFSPVRRGLLQRKCACGGTPGPSGECEECGKKKQRSLQTKLAINRPGDIYEQEADRIADQVTATTAPHAVSRVPLRIQRLTGQSNGQMDAAPASVDQVLASPGRALDPELQQDMGRRFGYDFSSVRVHSNARAEESARDLNAQAYTLGQDIIFASGRFSPGTLEGRRLLAHELTHVVQQQFAQPQWGSTGLVQRAPGDEAKHPKTDGGVEKADDKPSPTPGGGASPPCDPKSLPRADYLKAPGTSTDDFGLTQLKGTVTGPVVHTSKTARGLVLDATDAQLAPLTSVCTGSDVFVEGEGIFLGDGAECPNAKYPLKWLIDGPGAQKIREAELEHCADFQYAFAISLRRYADVVNDLAAKKVVFSSQKAAENRVARLVGPAPDTWTAVFNCLAAKTKIRDTANWHTPRPVKMAPRLKDDCAFARAIVSASSLPEVGKHPPSEIIKDCHEIPAAKATGGSHASGAQNKPTPDSKSNAKVVVDHDGAVGVPPVVDEVLRSPGQPLDAQIRAFMEPRFGHDFSRVRVHTDARAAESANSVNASAYTVGRSVVFAHGQYRPATTKGRELLAHELAHVAQQSSAPSAADELTIDDPRSSAELQADQFAHAVVSTSSPERPGIQVPASAETSVFPGSGPKPGAGWHVPAAAVLQRSRSNIFSAIAGFFSSIFHGIFGWSHDKLQEYLDGVKKTNDIEGDPDSDDKARAIVKQWMTDRSAFALSPPLKRLLILELLDGPTTKGDEEAIMDLLETSHDNDLAEILGPGGVNPKQLQDDIDDKNEQQRLLGFFSRRYKGGLAAVLKGSRDLRPYSNLQAMDAGEMDQFIAANFTGTNQELARKILEDLRAVKQGELDFENEQELKSEIFKRMRVSQLMKESQSDNAFDYPENMKAGDCPDYNPAGFSYNARVNKAARPYWSNVIQDPQRNYYFELSPLGKQNAFEALKELFTPQNSICDRTLIHCDYLTTVIQLRAFAESIGTAEFDTRVRNGSVQFTLSYYGAEYITASDTPPLRGRAARPASPKSVSLQLTRPASEADLVIGDHVVFWNHLAYDALTVRRPGPWRLENAVLVDKGGDGEDLFEGHGAPTLGNRTVPGKEDTMLNELLAVYNREAVEPALDAARSVDEGEPNARANLTARFPQVEKGPHGDWTVRELDRNSDRPKRSYKLHQLTSTKDPELIGLRDPIDPTKMGVVERPVESRKEPVPQGSGRP